MTEMTLKLARAAGLSEEELVHLRRPALDIPYRHHEKWDGTGYPRGLKGEQIPFGVRLFAIADVWDALSCDRPYRKAWKMERVHEHIKSLAGTHFDPEAVNYFLNISREQRELLSAQPI